MISLVSMVSVHREEINMGITVAGLFLSIVGGVIGGLVLLPITSDAIRGRLFARKRNAMINARNELFETIEGMVLSGQTVGDLTFQRLAENVSRKYNADISALGSKDDYIALVLQAINCTKALPSDLKKSYSVQLQEQLEGTSKKSDRNYNTPIIDNNFTAEIIDEWREKSADEERNQDIRGDISLLSIFIATALGTLITCILYALNDYIFLAFLVLLCLSIFSICTSILFSVIGNKEPKNIEFFRKLVYKTISLIALTVFMLVIILFLR